MLAHVLTDPSARSNGRRPPARWQSGPRAGPWRSPGDPTALHWGRPTGWWPGCIGRRPSSGNGRHHSGGACRSTPSPCWESAPPSAGCADRARRAAAAPLACSAPPTAGWRSRCPAPTTVSSSPPGSASTPRTPSPRGRPSPLRSVTGGPGRRPTAPGCWGCPCRSCQRSRVAPRPRPRRRWRRCRSARPGSRRRPRARGRSTEMTVIELSSLWAGPLCGNLLRLAGARVVKVESTTRPDGSRAGPRKFFDVINGGKRGVALDLGEDDGWKVLRRLLGRRRRGHRGITATGARTARHRCRRARGGRWPERLGVHHRPRSDGRGPRPGGVRRRRGGGRRARGRGRGGTVLLRRRRRRSRRRPGGGGRLPRRPRRRGILGTRRRHGRRRRVAGGTDPRFGRRGRGRRRTRSPQPGRARSRPRVRRSASTRSRC